VRIVLASNNAKKLAELRELFTGLPLDPVSQASLGIAEAEEPHHSFVENALAKARHAARAAAGAAIADDSGLCVQTLAGEPGVHSAIFAGEVVAPPGADREARRRAQDAANNALLLERLATQRGDEARAAYFACTLVAIRHADDPEPLIATGRWHGRVLHEPRGSGGFGYDPLMFIDALGASVAELAPNEKHRFSHRALAAQAMRELLVTTWGLHR
jgi:XTP/dITP diphosphohydrolase